MKKILLRSAVGVVTLLVVIQLVPYGRSHTNPPVIHEPNWDAQTQELVSRACGDCHTNETVWPWYSNIAPISWLVQHDVEEGRSVLNFSEWGRGGEGEESDELQEVVGEGEMPPSQYLLLHSEAKLTQEERDQLIRGLMAISEGISSIEGYQESEE